MFSDAETILARLATCAGCDKSVDMSADPLYSFVGLVGYIVPDIPKTMCAECSCPIWLKTRLEANSCPLERWSA